MVLVGWGSVLLGGCPLRQLILAGEGNTDSAVTVTSSSFRWNTRRSVSGSSSIKTPPPFPSIDKGSHPSS